MSKEYANQSPLDIAKQAERDLNTHAAKTGARNPGSSATESGVDDSITSRFPGSEVRYGDAVPGRGDNATIPESEGGGVDPRTGKEFKARDYEGEGGPEDKISQYAKDKGGEDDARTNVR